MRRFMNKQQMCKIIGEEYHIILSFNITYYNLQDSLINGIPFKGLKTLGSILTEYIKLPPITSETINKEINK